jgi:hypothetical protein
MPIGLCVCGREWAVGHLHVLICTNTLWGAFKTPWPLMKQSGRRCNARETVFFVRFLAPVLLTLNIADRRVSFSSLPYNIPLFLPKTTLNHEQCQLQ